MRNIQFLTDESGNRRSAVIPIELFYKLIEAADLDECYEPIPYVSGPHDDEVIPSEVVGIQIEKGVNLQTAWRLFRNLSQEEVAAAPGISQAGVANMEKRAKPQKATLEKLARIYNCRVTQLTLD